MHASGIKNEAGENIITEQTIEDFLAAGADIILVPIRGRRHTFRRIAMRI